MGKFFLLRPRGTSTPREEDVIPALAVGAAIAAALSKDEKEEGEKDGESSPSPKE